MAPDVRCKLVNKLNNFNRLHNRKCKNAIGAPHGKLGYAAEGRTYRDRASTVLSLLKMLLMQFLPIHCGFHEMLTNPVAAPLVIG
jgi:hypothetical protein